MKKIVCVVCGMIVNEKNYDINNYAIINKNEENYIRYCPFCGVDEVYLKEEGKIYSIDKDSLDETTIKILDHAMKLEVFNGEFYEEASKLVKDEKLKKEFEDLSSIEYMHARIHKRLGGFSELPKLNRPNYKKYTKDEEFIELAKQREEHAINFYNKNRNKLSSEVINKVLIALTKVEKEHIIILTNPK